MAPEFKSLQSRDQKIENLQHKGPNIICRKGRMNKKGYILKKKIIKRTQRGKNKYSRGWNNK